MLNLISIILIILIIWFKTNAFVEYCNLFRFRRLFYMSEYSRMRHDDFSLEYIKFLLQRHNCIFTRLISCPICTTVWLSLILTPIFNHYYNIPIVIVSVIYLYYILDKLRK